MDAQNMDSKDVKYKSIGKGKFLTHAPGHNMEKTKYFGQLAIGNEYGLLQVIR